MYKDREVLRYLADRYFDIANSDKNKQNILRHKQVNDLKQPRPIVLIEEIPWGEMNINNLLTLQCENPYLRMIEDYMRKIIYKWTYLPADMVVTPYLPVHKIIHSTGVGINTVIKSEENYENIKSHTYIDQLKDEEDLEKLQYETITYDEETTQKQFDLLASLLGDLLPIKKVGVEPGGYFLGCRTWDEIVNYRGLDTLFYDLIDRPEFMHQLVGKFTDIYMDKIRQYEELNLLDGDAYYSHCTAALTNDLKPEQSHVKTKDVWGRGLAQIFASVSPDMHDEFDTQYMIKAMEPFGLVYYGCCEPLDKKIHVLEQIKNLRKISITPWANIDLATEIMQNRYVVAAKPNPSNLAVSRLQVDDVKNELKRIVNACKRNGCSCDIVLKDITTVGGRPENLFEWEKIAMEIVQNY